MGASAQAQATQNAISLRGSTQIVTEFFGYAVNRCNPEWPPQSASVYCRRRRLVPAIIASPPLLLARAPAGASVAVSHPPDVGLLGMLCCPPLITAQQTSVVLRPSILYQRGIYPPESFDRQKKYGLAMMVTSDEGLTKYLTSVLKQMSGTSHPVPAPLWQRAQASILFLHRACALQKHQHCYACLCPPQTLASAHVRIRSC